MVTKYGDLYLQTRRAFMTQEDGQTAGVWARNLMCKASGLTKEQLLARQEIYASEQICLEVGQAVSRVLQGEPIAYVLGEWDFFGLTLTVTPDVLIPRDDTCAVTELALGYGSQLEQPIRILDLCCGSGCIGLALASRLPKARVTCADLSEAALAVTKTNIARNQLSGRVSAFSADALKDPDPFLGAFDIIVSNPPYITATDMTQLPSGVKDYEPHMALYGGEDGLDFYRNIARNYQKALKPGGYLCFEFGMGQGDDVCAILCENGYTVLERTMDYNERERAVIARYDRKD